MEDDSAQSGMRIFQPSPGLAPGFRRKQGREHDHLSRTGGKVLREANFDLVIARDGHGKSVGVHFVVLQ